MPSLPLPAGPVALDGGDLPVSDETDVVKLLPFKVKQHETAPVRDALATAFSAVAQEHQNQASYAAAQCDILRAEGMYLDGLGEDRGVFRVQDEGDEAYRARILATPEVVTPEAIVGLCESILSPYTDTPVTYYESLDQLFVDDGTATWSSHVFAEGSGPYCSPSYGDRLYPDDIVANGAACRHRRPLGACVFADNVGRLFVLNLPDVGALDERFGAVTDGSTDEGFYADDGTASADMSNFSYRDSVTADSVYVRIINTVDRAKAHGIRWSAIVQQQPEAP